jgi:hypothetical protein
MSRSLPANASLRHLRKEAKDILKAHGQGSPSVCRVLRHLRRFDAAPEGDILAADLALHEVQFALALDYGFSNWNDLKAHVEARASAAPASDAEVGPTILDGAGGFSNVDPALSHMRAIRHVLEYHGQRVDWGWLMGVCGEAFCCYCHPVGTYLTQHVHSWDVANAALQHYGYAGRWTTPGFTNDVPKLLAPLHAEIAKGRPAIAPGIVPAPNGVNSRCDHWYVVVGVDAVRGTVTVAGHGDTLIETGLPAGDAGPSGPHPCWYGIIRTFAPGSNGHYGPDRPIFVVRRTGSPQEPKQAAIAALKRAVLLAREEFTQAIAGWGKGTYLAGHKALASLRNVVQAAEGDGVAEFQRLNPEGADPFGGFVQELEHLQLLTERRSAARDFLQQLSGMWGHSASSRLKAAAEQFRLSGREAMAAFTIAQGPDDKPDRIKELGEESGNAEGDAHQAAVADKANRGKIAQHLSQALEHEQSAVAEIEAALAAVG